MKKSGPRVRAGEFEALKHAQSLGVPVPIAHQFISEEQTIYMEHVEGDCLETVWPNMSEDEKKSIAQQLGQAITLMRSSRQNGILIGAIDGLARDCRRYGDYVGGPFTEEESFNAFVLDLYTQCPQSVREALSSKMRSDHSIRFTHADLSPRNIIVRDGKIQGIVDWEFSGWYPEYWEYVKFFECKTKCKDWKNYAPYIFEEPYGEDLVTQQAILRWQRP
jgi:aminoglycoside phosphotransferase (APT) family kinase protein